MISHRRSGIVEILLTAIILRTFRTARLLPKGQKEDCIPVFPLHIHFLPPHGEVFHRIFIKTIIMALC